MKNKKGSQIGMIMSFTLFIISLIFIYTIVGSPIKKINQNQDSLNIVKENVLNLIQANVILERIYTNNIGCVALSIPSNSFGSLQAIATSNGSRVGSYLDTNEVRVENSTGELKIYYSSNYFNVAPECSSTCSVGSCYSPSINSLVSEKVAVEKLILNVVNQTEFNNSYASTLGIPSGNEYAVLFKYSNGTVVGKDVNNAIKTNIYSASEPISYLNLDGIEKRGNIIIKIW